MSASKNILLLQLPIPPLGPGRIRGNVPLAAGYLKMYAELQGLQSNYDIQILPSSLANTLSEQGLVEAILDRDPWMVGFSCYLWNIDRTLWIVERLKQRRPGLKIVLGGPKITIDNAWVLQQSSVDYFVIGEGEQTFAALHNAHFSGYRIFFTAIFTDQNFITVINLFNFVFIVLRYTN